MNLSLALWTAVALAAGVPSPDDAEVEPGAPGPFVATAAPYQGTFDRAPVTQWSVPLPGPVLNAATHTERARPVMEGPHIFVGSTAGDGLYVLDRRNGAVMQKLPAEASVESEPLVTADRVYFTDTGGFTWCYDRDGVLVWKHASNAPILVRPTLEDGVVYVTNVDDLVMALDAATGALKWRYQQPADVTRRAELALYAAPPAIVQDGLVYVGFSEGSLVALTAVAGEVQWQLRVGEGRYPDVVAEPTVASGTAFVSGYYEPLVAIDTTTRKVAWELPHGAAGAVSLVDTANGPRILHPGTDGVLRAIEPTSGDVTWTWTTKDGGALTSTVLTPAGALVGGATGTLWMIDEDTGKERWRFRPSFTPEGVSAAPSVQGRQLLFVTNAGNLYSMLAPAPEARWPR